MLAGLNLGWRRRVPLVLQTEASECGLASLAMVAQFHGHRTSLTDLRRHYGLSLKGASLREIMRIADQLGFATRPLRLELEELSALRVPCVLHWDLNHFVVLVAVGKQGATIHDPAFGTRRLSLKAMSRHFTGVALELTPTERFVPATAVPRVQMQQLLGRMRGVRRSLAMVLALALAIELFAILAPLFLSWVVDHAVVSGDRALLLTLMLGFSLLLVMQTAIAAMRGWFLMCLKATLKAQAPANLFAHLVNLPAPFFETRHLADVVSRFSSQSTILQALTGDLVEAILDGLLATLTVVLMLLIAPGMALAVVGGAVLYGLLRSVFHRRLRAASAEAIVWSARRDSHFLETLRGIRTVKLFNAQDQRRVQWLNLLVEAVNRQLTGDKLRLLFRNANALVLGLLSIFVIWLGAHRILDGSLSVGLLFAFLSYKDQFVRRVSELIDKSADLAVLRLHAERLADIALTVPEAPDMHWLPLAGDQPPAKVELRGVKFRYGEQEPWILNGIDLQVEAGESLVIVGPSGCGKSTILKLLAGLLRPTEGEILVNGEPLQRVGLHAYRSMLGVVMQDDQLFAGSIADNISFFAESSDRERIADCARLAAIHDDIVAMPMGYASLIGDMGTILSGGQKQRVLLARALYRRPAILLLDEATSHLDIGREKAVSDALAALRVTRIVIAHRPETIRAAKRVVALANGRLAEATPGPSNSAARDLRVFGRLAAGSAGSAGSGVGGLPPLSRGSEA